MNPRPYKHYHGVFYKGPTRHSHHFRVPAEIFLSIWRFSANFETELWS